jgi:hypothetical protein
MSPNERASPPSLDASSDETNAQPSSRPSTQPAEHDDLYGRGPAMNAVNDLKAINLLPLDEQARAAAEFVRDMERMRRQIDAMFCGRWPE